MRRRLALLFVFQAASVSAATFTVTNTNDSGAGSLRKAIDDANATAGADTIAFDVSGAGCDGSGVCTIAPATPFAVISSPVTIDGYTQSGASQNTNAEGAINAVLKVVLSGVSVGGSPAMHFSTGAAGSTVRGLVFNGGWGYTIRVHVADVAVRGCFIGTDASGMTATGDERGVYGSGPTGASGLAVGGPQAADRNLIAGHEAQEIWLEGVPDATIEGNLIGTDKTGAASFPDPPNNGIILAPVQGAAIIRGNVVAAGDGGAILVGNLAPAAFETVIQGNFIGTDVTGTVNLGNPGSGIYIWTTDVTVGGTGPGEGNVIAFNGAAGVYLDNIPERCAIRGNSIYSNHQNPLIANQCLGIDFSNVGPPVCEPTRNDLGDADTGPNGRQNFPIITSVVSTLSDAPEGGTTTIAGRLNSAPGTTYTVDFYGNSACVDRPQSFLEGKTWLGSDEVTTDGSGDAPINVVLPVSLGPGTKVTATATDPDGNTSELSQRIVLSATPRSGPPAGGPVSLDGFHFLAGATVTVGGAAATGVNVASYNQITATVPNLLPGTLNDIVVTNTDGSAGTLPNGWIADFLDVPGNHIFHDFVTTLVRNQITVGIGGGIYGVDQSTLRQQMAVFLLKAKYGICYVPPPCTVPAFPDVPCASNFAPWINQLVVEGITGGCAGGNFCPANPVNRQQMAIFLLKTFEGGSYAPPDCTVASFSDVPCSHPFADWIYELVARNITGGCGGGLYCPLNNATRGQMATFLVKTFGLQ